MKNKIYVNESQKTIDGFGNEWEKFDQSILDKNELDEISKRYFDIFPLEKLSKEKIGFDLGCGSGRFSIFIADKVKLLHCIDPSDSINVAKKKLKHFNNCVFHKKKVEDLDLDDHSMDFGFSLGVLHHTLDPQRGISICGKMLKKDAPFLIYLYYAFDNKPMWFRLIWNLSNFFRLIISRLPNKIKNFVTEFIAFFIYFPLARISKLLEKFFKLNVENLPLSAYRNLSYYTMRTDSLDRFGTRIEKRFTKKQIEAMLIKAGFYDISFSDKIPYWCAICYKN